MTQQTIEIDGLPEGWEVTKVNITDLNVCGTHYGVVNALVELKKIQPRRIVLEETAEGNHTAAFHNDDGVWTYWKEVKE